MNAERLLQHYERIADAPDAIARLRRFILDLAVRGKLVQQHANDEPASELLKRIAKEKARLVKAGDIKREKPAESASVGDLGIDLPAGWSVACLSEIAVCLDYRRVPINGTERDARIEGKPQEDLFPYYGATQQQGWIDDHLFDGEFVLLGEDGVPFHDPLRTKAYLISGKSWVNNHAHVFQGILTSPRFLVHYLNVFDYAGRVVGATRAKLNQAQAVTIPIPLPPLSEQHRIVAKVDELMGLCDRLEAARAGREAVRDRLAVASLARLNAPDPEAFQNDARFALDALPALTTRPDQIKRLRQTILNLAVRGKLVPQDANDEPASELLKRIGADENANKADAEHELPISWAWALIEDCFVISGGMQKTPARTPKANAFPYLGVGNVYRNRLDLATVKKFELAPGELERFRLEPQDILVVEGNGSASEIGRCAVWNGEIENCVHQNHIIRCRPKALQLTAFAVLYLNSPDGMAEMKRLAITSAGLFSLSVGKIRKIPFPLPPLAEQHRIVAKIDALMALCDRLEASLTVTAATRRRLLDALLAEALAPAETPAKAAAE